MLGGFGAVHAAAASSDDEDIDIVVIELLNCCENKSESHLQYCSIVPRGLFPLCFVLRVHVIPDPFIREKFPPPLRHVSDFSRQGSGPCGRRRYPPLSLLRVSIDVVISPSTICRIHDPPPTFGQLGLLGQLTSGDIERRVACWYRALVGSTTRLFAGGYCRLALASTLIVGPFCSKDCHLKLSIIGLSSPRLRAARG